MSCFNITRFHFCVMVFWQLGKFMAAQMLFPVFGNYVPKWRCSTNETFGKNCEIMASCKDGVEFENQYFKSSGECVSDIHPFPVPSALEFGWICGHDAYFTAIYIQIQLVGIITGTTIFGTMSDARGRRPTTILALTCGVLSFLLSGMSPIRNCFIGLLRTRTKLANFTRLSLLCWVLYRRIGFVLSASNILNSLTTRRLAFAWSWSYPNKESQWYVPHL